MPWVTKDDQFPEHPKNWALSDAAYRLHDAGIHYCNRHQTDGRVPASKVRSLVPKFRPAALCELTDRAMWVPLGNGDWEVHDYLDWNKSKAEIDAARAARSKGGRKGMQSRWG